MVSIGGAWCMVVEQYPKPRGPPYNIHHSTLITSKTKKGIYRNRQVFTGIDRYLQDPNEMLTSPLEGEVFFTISGQALPYMRFHCFTNQKMA